LTANFYGHVRKFWQAYGHIVNNSDHKLKKTAVNTVLLVGEYDLNLRPGFDVSLTVHLSINLASDQLDAQIF